MSNVSGWLFEPSTLTPHGFCLLWEPWLIWTSALGDAAIGASYFAIPFFLARFARRRRDLVFRPVFWLFAAFILLCGTGHWLHLLTLWVPAYGAEALVKGATAVVSIGTAIALWPLLPRALALPSPAQMRAANAELERLAEERGRAADALRASEGRLRLALEAAGAGAWELDPATGISAWDQAALAMFRLPRAEMPFEEALAALVHPDDRGKLREAMEAALVGEGRFAVEHRVPGDNRVPPRWLRTIGSVQHGECPARGPVRVVCLTADITEQRAWEERQSLLVAELNHRVKNTLSVVQALAEQTRRAEGDARREDDRRPGKEERRRFYVDFQARLLALARAHDLLTRENWTGALLADVLAAVADPFRKVVGAGPADGRAGPGAAHAAFEASGPPARVPPEASVTLAMAFHELATNATKYGALSVPGGRVSVDWRPTANRGVELLWAESGGPPVAPPPPGQRGFGSRLLERGLVRQLGSAVALDFEPGGVRCRISLPPTAAMCLSFEKEPAVAAAL